MDMPWPHAPPHDFTPHGVYMLTAGTLHKASLFDTAAKLDLFRNTTLDLNPALFTQPTGMGVLQ